MNPAEALSDGKTRTSKEQQASALVPREVPSLPKGNMPRRAVLNGIKKALFRDREAEGNNYTAGLREGATLLVQGMGGSGKTVVASSIARDSEVGLRFSRICFAGVGQDGDLRDLHKSLYFQLTNTVLPASLRETSEVFAALQEAAVGQNVLLVIDDAWKVLRKIRAALG